MFLKQMGKVREEWSLKTPPHDDALQIHAHSYNEAVN